MDRIGKYEVLDKVGSGGFAVVYKGFDPFIKRPVAIKVCYARDEETRQRFHREAEIAGRLVHRNVTTVYDFGLHDGIPYLVEEYLPGEDLAHLIRRREPEALEEKLDLLLQIAGGLEYAHSQGIIHRDVKPANVRVLDSGRAKIMDFGTAKMADLESQLTQAGITLGTVAYLSPERLRGQPTRLNSDVFSYGVLAYELLSFQRPFEGKNIPLLIDTILTRPPRPLPEAWPECPPRLVEVVHRCLEKDPEERYLSFTELILDLERFREEHSGATHTTAARSDELPRDGSGGTPRRQLHVTALLERVRELVDRSKIERAEALLDEILEIDPEHEEARKLLGECREARQAAEETLGSGERERRREQKIAEAVEAIAHYLDTGHPVQAAEALTFAVRLFGDFEEAHDLRQRLVDDVRRQLRQVHRRGSEASVRAVAVMEALHAEDRLPLGEAERIARWVEELDVENRGGEPILAALREAAEPKGPGRPPQEELRTQKEAEAVASIEQLLDDGEPGMAKEALDFALHLFGHLDRAAELEARIARALERSERS